MLRIIELAKHIINCCIDNDFDVDTKRLENILIILQGAFLSRIGKKLFSEEVFIRAENVHIVGFEKNSFLFNQKTMIFLKLTDDEERIIQNILQDIYARKINIYLFYHTNQGISILSEEEIKNLFTNSYN